MDYENITMFFDGSFMWVNLNGRYICQFCSGDESYLKQDIHDLFDKINKNYSVKCIASNSYRKAIIEKHSHEFNHDYLNYLLLG